MRRMTVGATACLMMVSAVALAQQVTYDYDRTADFRTYTTYAWTRGTELPDEIVHARLVNAIDARLHDKGLRRVDPDGSPDVLIAYHASFEKNLRIDGFTTGWGPLGLGDRSGTARVEDILVGTLVVDIRDARTNALVWRGLVTGDIKPTDKPEQRDKKVNKATEKMFTHYPPRS